jgi:radical SAM protein with 4Fe4S-binding SPASM domain
MPPQHAIWEMTWRCNLRCTHCLVHGGPNDVDELSTSEGLDLLDQMAALGVRRVTLTGGEPFFRRDWPVLARRVRDHDMELVFSCNGHMLNKRTMEMLCELKTAWIAVSVDGLPATHDAQRVFPATRAGLSSWAIVTRAIRTLVASPIQVAVITSVHRDNLDELPELHERLKTLGVDEWMVQLAHPQGRFAEGEERDKMLAAHRLPELVAFLVGASEDPILAPLVHNTIGWMSKYEPHLRGSGRAAPPRGQLHLWRGSPCGRTVLGIEPDGGIKGCPNQVGDPFVVGHIRRESLAAIWADRARWHWLNPAPDAMKGSCEGCVLSSHCGGGCPCVALETSGRLFDNPYCTRVVENQHRLPA